ncbi:MAG: 3-coathanger stack domain-containing protein [Bacteroidota bacterium]
MTRFFKSTLALITILSFALHFIQAKTYYLDATLGNNQNDGLSPNTAWQDTIMRAIFPGDTILFKRGEIWKRRWYSSTKGTATKPIVYSAYGNINDPLPIISSVVPLTDATNSTNWSNDGNNIWKLRLESNPRRFFLDHEEVLRANTLADVGLNDTEGFLGEWFYTDTMLYLYATQNPAFIYQSFEGSNEFITFTLERADHHVLQYLDFRGGSGASLRIAGAKAVEVKHCKLGNQGNSGILVRNSLEISSSKVSIHDNIFDSKFQFLHGLGTERGCDDGLRMVLGVDSSSVFRNTFKNWAHNAIELVGDQDTLNGVNYNQFYDNYIHAPDIPYAHPLGADGILGKCQFNEFYRNTIENCRTASQINGNDNWVHHNLIRGMRRTLAKANVSAHAFVLGVYGANLVSQNNRFEHNTIMDTDEAGFLVRGYGYSNQVKDNLIQNNILFDTGKAPYNNAYAVGTGLVIYDTNTDGLDGNTYRNNLFYSSIPNYQAVFLQDSSRYYSASQFNSRSGIDKDTISNNIDGDPLFMDFAMRDYRLSATSPAIDVGISTNSTLDFLLNDRMVGITADIGALELGTDCFDSLAIHNFPIMNADYEAQDHIESIGFVKNDGIVSFQASTSIVLKAGFRAVKGSQFTASIFACSSANQIERIPKESIKSRVSFSDQSVLSVFPNPMQANEPLSIHLEILEESDIELSIYSSAGKMVYQSALYFSGEGLHRYAIPNLDLARGIYYINLKSEKHNLSQLLVVQ